MRLAGRFSGLLLAGLVLTHPAEAHIVSSRLGDFYGGMLHPLTALPDLILWLALGLLAAFQRSRAARWLVVLFPLSLVAGLLLGQALGVAPELGRVDAGLMIVLGALVAGAVQLAPATFLVGGVALGLYRGLCNASGITPEADVVLFAGGTAAVGYAAMTVLMAGTVAFRRAGAGWQDIALRAGGSWIAAIGLMVGGLAFIGS